MLDDSLLLSKKTISLVHSHHINHIIAEGVKDLGQVYICDTDP